MIYLRHADKVHFAVGAMCIISGAFYLAAEFLAVMYCSSPLSAYFLHTISELGVPIGEPFDGVISSFSPAAPLMNGALIAAGSSLAFCLLSFYFLNGRRADFMFPKSKRVSAIICAVLASLGTATVGICHAGSAIPVVETLHYIGASAAFFGGNLFSIITSGCFYEISPSLAVTGKAVGFFGIIFGAVTVALQFLTPFKSLSGITERLTVYPIVLWDICVGVFMLKQNGKNIPSRR